MSEGERALDLFGSARGKPFLNASLDENRKEVGSCSL